MKVELCDLCNKVIKNNDEIVKVKAKRKVFSFSYEYGMAMPESFYQGITICPYCIRAIVKKSKELRKENEHE